MYEGGLRIGEALGLTADDIRVEEVDGEYIGVVYIKNRVSDKSYQRAKTAMKVFDKREYSSKEYNNLDIGFQCVPIDLNLVETINIYINKHVKYMLLNS
jgi:hypothetical protein